MEILNYQWVLEVFPQENIYLYKNRVSSKPKNPIKLPRNHRVTAAGYNSCQRCANVQRSVLQDSRRVTQGVTRAKRKTPGKNTVRNGNLWSSAAWPVWTSPWQADSLTKPVSILPASSPWGVSSSGRWQASGIHYSFLQYWQYCTTEVTDKEIETHNNR